MKAVHEPVETLLFFMLIGNKDGSALRRYLSPVMRYRNATFPLEQHHNLEVRPTITLSCERGRQSMETAG